MDLNLLPTANPWPAAVIVSPEAVNAILFPVLNAYWPAIIEVSGSFLLTLTEFVPVISVIRW